MADSPQQWYAQSRSQKRSIDFLDAQALLAQRTANRLGRPVNVSKEQALRHSAVWACLRLRADLVSTMPLNVYRNTLGVQVEEQKPPVLVKPGGRRVRLMEWLFSTQWDLDSTGNTFGIISERDRYGLPARIDLVPVNEVTILSTGGVISYKIGNTPYSADDIWHERQYTQSGLPVGLSPIAYAAMSINGYLSAQQFASDWFANSATPAQHLRNTSQKFDKKTAYLTKTEFESSTVNGGTFVSGSDWELKMITGKASESQFLEERQFGLTDVCRFFGVPGDMIDAEPTGAKSDIVYANVTQKNLQLLIQHLNPALLRREETFSAELLPNPRFAEFNRAALLQMDLPTRYAAYAIATGGKPWMVPSEVRTIEKLPPFTSAQLAEAQPVAALPTGAVTP